MKALTLLLAALYFASLVIAAPTASPAESLTEKPMLEVVKRTLQRRDANPDFGKKMLSLSLGQSLFTKVGDMIENVIPAQINSMYIEDIEGSLPPLISIPGMNGDTNYKVFNIKFKDTNVADGSGLTLKNDHAVVDIHGMDLSLVADYELSSKSFFVRKESKGKLDITIRGGKISGAVGIQNNGKGGILIWMSDTQSTIEHFSISLKDTWWYNWMQNFAAKIAKPIIATAIGAVIQTAVPPLVNVIFENTISVGFVSGNGYALRIHSELVGEPKITPQAVYIGINLVSKKRMILDNSKSPK